MKKILCVGGVTTDILVKPVNSVLQPGVLCGVDSIDTHVGGCAANAAIDLAKLGAPVRLCCRVGTDQFGDFVIKTAAEAGVDTHGIVQRDDPGTTISVVCIQHSGERSFLYYPGSSAAFCLDDIPADAAEGYDIVFVAGSMILNHFDGVPCAQYLDKLRKAGLYTVMDTCWDSEDIWLPKLEAAFPYVDLFMPSYDEAVKLSGKTELPDIADFFFNLGVGYMVIKVGKDGAYLQAKGEKGITLPTYSSVSVKDTTGAGDAFCAGFLAGLAQDMDMVSCAKLANAVGTHCVMEIGASTGIKPLAQIEAFMENNPL